MNTWKCIHSVNRYIGGLTLHVGLCSVIRLIVLIDLLWLIVGLNKLQSTSHMRARVRRLVQRATQTPEGLIRLLFIQTLHF